MLKLFNKFFKWFNLKLIKKHNVNDINIPSDLLETMARAACIKDCDEPDGYYDGNLDNPKMWEIYAELIKASIKAAQEDGYIIIHK